MFRDVLVLITAVPLLLLVVVPRAAGAGPWHEERVFDPADVPLPSTAPAGATVHGVYSPSVCRIAGGYVMFFGVSIHYNIHHDVYRDSIAYASSADGISNWKFLGYILEPFPDKSVQNRHRDQWPVGTLYQVNDPSVLIRKAKLYIAYTSVKWKYPPTTAGPGAGEVGCIGLATFRVASPRRFALIRRDDTWLEPTRTSCISTCSRPEFCTREDGSLMLWFDSAGTLCSIRVEQLDAKLDIRHATTTRLSGAVDVFVWRHRGKYLALANHPHFIPICESADGKRWSAWRPFYRPKAPWACDGVGSPCLLTGPAPGAERLYFGGILMKNAHQYDKISIGVAYRRLDP